MKPSFVVSIILRLFAISWLTIGAIQLLPAFGRLGGAGSNDITSLLLSFAAPGAYFLFAALTWTFAPAVSVKVVGSTEPEVGLGTITPTNLYTLGLVLVGSYTALDHLGPAINWLHFLAANRAGDALVRGENNLSIYDISSQLIPCAAGIALAIGSPALARKLERASIKLDGLPRETKK